VLEANPNYWGTKPIAKTVVFQWNGESAQRLVQLQSGAADGIDNVGTTDFDTVKNDGNLQLVERPALNVFYVGFNVTTRRSTTRRCAGDRLRHRQAAHRRQLLPEGLHGGHAVPAGAIPGLHQGLHRLHLRPGEGQAAPAGVRRALRST
jgi:peptide/nickel transport system substrate-binding protein